MSADTGAELPSLTTIQLHQEHVKRMEEKVKKQKEVVKKSQKKRDDEQKELIKRSKEKQIIKKDKEKTREKWKKMMDKLDSQFLDDLASIKFASKLLAKNEDKNKDKKNT